MISLENNVLFVIKKVNIRKRLLMSVLMIPDSILFSKTVLFEIWSITLVLVLGTLVGLWIRGRNPFQKPRLKRFLI